MSAQSNFYKYFLKNRSTLSQDFAHQRDWNSKENTCIDIDGGDTNLGKRDQVTKDTVTLCLTWM